MSDVMRFAIAAAAWTSICAIAIARGGWPERTGAIAALAASILTPLVQGNPAANGPEWGFLAVDAAMFGLFLWIALKSDRWWTLFAAAFLLLLVVSDLTLALAPGQRFVNLIQKGTSLWSYLHLAAIAGGVLEMEWRRRQPGLTPQIAGL